MLEVTLIAADLSGSQECFSYIFILRGCTGSSRTVIVVTASVKEDQRRGQGHTSTSLLFYCEVLRHSRENV
jgi:hypothetical protein